MAAAEEGSPRSWITGPAMGEGTGSRSGTEEPPGGAEPGPRSGIKGPPEKLLGLPEANESRMALTMNLLSCAGYAARLAEFHLPLILLLSPKVKADL